MGVEFDLISDATREGYELGKGCWYELTQALRSSDPVAAIVKFLVDDDHFDPQYAAEVACEVVAFAAAHPDWRIIDDCGSSDISVMTDEERERTLAEERAEGLIEDGDEVFPIYRRIGSRYRRSG